MAFAPGNPTSYNLAPDANGLQANARQRLALMLAQSGADTSPVGHWSQGLARVANAMMGNYELGLEDRKDEAEKKAGREAIAAFISGGQPQGAPPAVPQMPPPGAPSPANPTTVPMAGRAVQVIEDGDNKPSPLDPPSGQDKDIAIRTIYGEDPGASAAGVAQVLRRRAIDGNFGGSNLTDVALAKNQFEPWSNPDARARMQGLSPDSPTYKRLEGVLSQAYAPEATDPTNGATHFFAPKAQAALGRDVPKWATGPVTNMGPHAFYGGTGQPAPVQVAGPVPTPDSPQVAALDPRGVSPQPAPTQPSSGPQMAQADSPQMRGGFVQDRKAALIPLLNNKYAAPFAQQMLQKEMEKEQNTVRPLTNPQERAKFGIQPTDTNAYQVDSQGKVSAVNPQPFSVNVNQQGQSEFEKTYGEGLGKQALSVLERGNGAAIQKQKVMLAQRMLDDIQTGKLTPAQATVGGYMQSLGIDPKAFGINPNTPMTAEALTALTSELVIGKIGAGGFPANNFSNPDREFLVQGVFKLGDRPEANFLKLEVAKRIAALDEAKADAWAEARASKQSYEDFERVWRKKLGGQSVFGDLIEQSKAFGESNTARHAPPPPSGKPGGQTKSGLKWSVD